MSLWGATVITSLASALPVVGTSIVGWLWGGFSVNWRLEFVSFTNFLENFAYCGNNFFIDGYNPFKECFILESITGFVKIPSIHSQSADVWAVKKISTAPASQRLYAKEQAWLVGFYEADGWFGVFKNGKYVQYEFGMELHKRDESLLYQIKNKYKLSGTVRIRKDRPDIVVLKVRNKKDLITKIVPIFDEYPMIGPKIQQYNFFRYHLIEKKTVLSEHLNFVNSLDFMNPMNSLDGYKERCFNELLQIYYFNSWLIGFINGEGCFSVYKASKETNNTCSFDIAQKCGGFTLLKAIQSRLKLKTTIYKDKTECYKLKVSSVYNCAQVLKFISSQQEKLKGYKRIQYIAWVKHMRLNPRYSSIKIPSKL